MPPEDDPVEAPENPIVPSANDSVEDRSVENDLSESPENSPAIPEEETQERTEAQFIAQLAAELATPLPVDDSVDADEPSVSNSELEAAAETTVESPVRHEAPSERIKEEPAPEPIFAAAPVVKAEPVISPERLAMRQLQGRMRKNLLLKRPVQAMHEDEEPARPPENAPEENTVSDESVPAAESRSTKVPKSSKAPAAESVSPVTEPDLDATMELSVLVPPTEETEAPEVGLAAKEASSVDENAGLVAKAETETNLKVADKPEETAAPRQIPAVPTRQVIRVEKSSESFTQLHTAIEYAVGNPNFHTDGLMDSSLFQSNRPIVLGVTSAIEGEGKTTVALHLAMDIARNNFKKVCLMDMSLGEDTLSHRLEINTGTGLVNVLEGTEHKLPTVEPAEYEGLSIMPAGKVPDNAARAARSPAVTEVLNAGRKLFDVIIVDMPSITSGNVLPIAPHLDAVVMVVYAGVTPKEVVAGALEKLDKNKVLGVVLNRVRTSMPSWLQKRLNRW
jgi:Mrp family chromosome partitioning ATPase